MSEEILRKHMLRLAYAFRGEPVFRVYKEIAALEGQTLAEFKSYQEKKLSSLARHLINTIPYYQKASTALSLPGKTGTSLIHAFDAVDRTTISSRISEFIDPSQRVSWRSTSGSSGTPFVFPKDRLASGYMDAAMYRAYGWHGIQIGDRQARLWGGGVTAKTQVSHKIKDTLLGRRRLSVFKCDEESYATFLKNLEAFKPKYFYSYSNALYQFALYVEEKGRKGGDLGISVAMCTGEMLYQHQREKISEVFDCQVVNEYGSTENGIIGFECKSGSMHVMPTIYLEIEDPDNEGYGSALVTEINSRTIPFIRYRLGDVIRAVEGRCTCGLPFPCIEMGKGRSNDRIVRPDGIMVYATMISYVLKNHVRKFQAYQPEVSELLIRIVPGKEWSQALEKRVEQQLRKHLGPDMEIKFFPVPDILSEKSGKLRYFISDVKK